MKDLRAALAQISSQGWRADRNRECPRPARATHSEQARRAKNERKIKPNTATTAKPRSAEIARSDALGYYQTQTKLVAAVLSPPKDGRFLTLPDADPCLNRPAQKKNYDYLALTVMAGAPYSFMRQDRARGIRL
jgi:hypothetical protein